MSLFKVRDWWSVQCGSDEEFDQNSLCIANVDNNPNGSDKIIVGSHSGVLRIFSINSCVTDDGNLLEYQASDLLMEADFKIPILQVSAGLLLSATTNIQLVVLHSRKLSVYSISSTAGVTEHGSSYNILLIYEHILQRNAYNMTIGPFGQVKGKDFLCVQSLDGNLSFYEQESLAFNRFLPNVLLPGPITYVPHSDSFILATSSWTVESYRYQVLAIAKNEESVDRTNTTKGRKVTPDWSVTVGESVIDIKVVLLEKHTCLVIVMGERNLFVLKDNGTIWFTKKFDFNPSCLHLYPNETNDSAIILVATYVSSLLIYMNDILKWATQLPFTPIAVKRANFSNFSGAIVCLSDEGLLCSGYLGTNPSIKIVSVPNIHTNITNYAQSELELQELKKIINSHNLDGHKATTDKEDKEIQEDMSINVSDVQTISTLNGKISTNPLVKITLQIEWSANISDIRITIDSQLLIIEPNLIIIPSSSSTDEPYVTDIIIWKDIQYLPSAPKLIILVSYVNSDGAPRIASKSIYIPINIFVKLSLSTKETEHKVSFDIINKEPSGFKLTDLFSDIFDSDNSSRNSIASTNNSTSIALEIYDTFTTVTIMTAIKSVNQKFTISSDCFGSLAFIANELLRRLKCNNVKFDTSTIDKSFVPLIKVFALIDQHFSSRLHVISLKQNLSDCASQYRAIQKRLLIKLKDRNPSSLNNLDILLKVIHNQILSYSDKLMNAIIDLNRKTSYLSSSINLICHLMLISNETKFNSIKHIQSIFSQNISINLEEGWEERTELALITLIDTHAKEISYASKFTGEFTPPENTENLKKMITSLTEHLFHADSNKEVNNHKNFIKKSETILEASEFGYESNNDNNLQIIVN